MSGSCLGIINVTNPCVPFWQCEPGGTGFEVDGCGNRRPNAACTYREAALLSCQWPVNAIAGQMVQVSIIITQGSVSENYKLVFSGDFIGASNPFTVNAGTGQQSFSIPLTLATAGTKNVTASLVKV